ncbi:hypothetical protein L486_02521 [Kwoniella mangroviensis CBS 10435]|uniref:Uncharacterized protein n=1 Tax=Kwoniella mangroviensis CBS 10435 TaxID=1331196 RepID=A0A1B9IWE6_9TREE|nr:hypothetical protein L486_02521 [Kwoniella mangroviensis CBS 10435]
MSSNVNTTSIRTTTPPTCLTISLNFRALSQSSNYNFDHDHALNPPASGYTGEAYSAISDLTCASDAKVVDWLKSPGCTRLTSNTDNFDTDQSGPVSILPSVQDEISITFFDQVEPLLQKYRDRTGKDVKFRVTFNQSPIIGDWETALNPIDIANGPDRWLDSIPQRGLQSHGSTIGNYEDDDGLSDVELSSEEEDSFRDDYTGIFDKSRDPASTAILDMWRHTVQATTLTSSSPEEAIHEMIEPPEPVLRLADGVLPGQDVPDEAGS